MNGAPMGTMNQWITRETEIRHEGLLPGRSERSLLARMFGRNHGLATRNDQSLRLALAGES